eukprot:1146063-Pelagomonas_calceolata.AAC.3
MAQDVEVVAGRESGGTGGSNRAAKGSGAGAGWCSDGAGKSKLVAQEAPMGQGKVSVLVQMVQRWHREAESGGTGGESSGRRLQQCRKRPHCWCTMAQRWTGKLKVAVWET